MKEAVRPMKPKIPSIWPFTGSWLSLGLDDLWLPSNTEILTVIESRTFSSGNFSRTNANIS